MRTGGRYANIGEMFLEWAEREWQLEKVIKEGIKEDPQFDCFQYYHIRKMFIDQINDLFVAHGEPANYKNNEYGL